MLDSLRLGIGLYLGQVSSVMSAEDRLDFTALGPAVNLAFRLEALTKSLGQPILVSQEFASACPESVAALAGILSIDSGR
jgi:adenylate cyclase